MLKIECGNCDKVYLVHLSEPLQDSDNDVSECPHCDWTNNVNIEIYADEPEPDEDEHDSEEEKQGDA